MPETEIIAQQSIFNLDGMLSSLKLIYSRMFDKSGQDQEKTPFLVARDSLPNTIISMIEPNILQEVLCFFQDEVERLISSSTVLLATFNSGHLQSVVVNICFQDEQSNFTVEIMTISKWNNVKVDIDRSTDCPVCFDSFIPGKELTVTKCHHVFHKQCLSTWMKVKPCCPYCRSSILI